MLGGVISFAVAIEEVVAHPDHALLLEGRIALAAGITLFIMGTAVALWRMTGTLLRPRIILTGGAALAALAIADIHPSATLAIILIGIVAVILIEYGSSQATIKLDE
jgi:hypothetical protein